MRLILIFTLLGAYSCVLAQEKKQITYYVHADTVAFYDKPDMRATPVGYYYLGDSLVMGKPAGLFSTLPLVTVHQYDQEYWMGKMDVQHNAVTAEWLEKEVNGRVIYIPGQGISTIPLPSFDDDSEYFMPEELIKKWLTSYAGEPTDSIHTLLPKVSEDDIHEKYQITYANRVEFSVEYAYDSYGIGSAFISVYLPDVKLTEAYWLAIRLYLGAQYKEVKWTEVNATDNSIGITSFSEGQTLEITANKEKEGIRLTWLYGGC